MSSNESDIEINSALPAKIKKLPKSPTQDLLKEVKKLSTREMINKALSESRSRKGLSLYAIKKYMQDNYGVDTEKIKYLIKKNIKESVEAGFIIQTKGIGASGSFRLAPGSKQPKKPTKRPKKPKETTGEDEKIEKPKKASVKTADGDTKPKKATKKVTISKTSKTMDKDTMKKSKSVKEKAVRDNAKPGSSSMKTPKKRANMMKRKSIGSIIKPPKMKPKAPAK
ncbi:histone H1, orphon-like [Pararge aegeria]|uniref:Jg6518 protein n=2 Tax=Pararge aegeria TaxID=116150 RepID=A0A8S4S575_9NEOP|nr:histone H1, orphon-like [Pararge aegeria]CAH2245571.1 jg6518 [Pararge aegeria aegeria]